MSDVQKAGIDWVESQGERLMVFVIESLDRARAEATTTLSILLAGAGACFFLAVEKWGLDAPLTAALLGVVVYLFGLAGALVWRCLILMDIYPPTNDPKNLWPRSCDPECDLVKLRENSLVALSERIRMNTEINQVVGSQLNLVRKLMVLTPAVFILVFAVVAVGV